MFCLGHVNGFRHLVINLNGLEKVYDIGYKIEEYEPFESVGKDLSTGVELYADPVLMLYVSITNDEGSIDLTLHYCLSRNSWQSAVKASEDDANYLLENSIKHIQNDVIKIHNGEIPKNSNIEQCKMFN